MNFHLPFSELLAKQYGRFDPLRQSWLYRSASNSEKGRWKFIFSSVLQHPYNMFSDFNMLHLVAICKGIIVVLGTCEMLLNCQENRFRKIYGFYAPIEPILTTSLDITLHCTGTSLRLFLAYNKVGTDWGYMLQLISAKLSLEQGHLLRLAEVESIHWK